MRKYHFFWITLGVGIISLAFADDHLLDCSKIRNGSFYYYSKKTRERVNVERVDSLQVETGKETGHVLRSKLIWKGNCSFDMYINAFSTSKLDQVDSMIAATPASVKIISIGAQYYICHVNLKIFDKDIAITDTIYFTKP